MLVRSLVAYWQLPACTPSTSGFCIQSPCALSLSIYIALESARFRLREREGAVLPQLAAVVLAARARHSSRDINSLPAPKQKQIESTLRNTELAQFRPQKKSQNRLLETQNENEYGDNGHA